jgi:hypothetical protein
LFKLKLDEVTKKPSIKAIYSYDSIIIKEFSNGKAWFIKNSFVKGFPAEIKEGL